MLRSLRELDMHFVVLILNRDMDNGVLDALFRNGVPSRLVSLGKGTARTDVLDLLGLAETEKAVHFFPISAKLWPTLQEDMLRSLHLDRPGTGVAMTVPIVALSRISRALLPEGREVPPEGEDDMTLQCPYRLILAIANYGYTDDVMDAANSVRPTGGTVIHALGVNPEKVERFFGVPIQPEREIILLLTPEEFAPAIMAAIEEKAGMSSRARTLSISLPVDNVAGLAKVLDA